MSSRIVSAEARISARDATGQTFAHISDKMRQIEATSRGMNTRMVSAASDMAKRVAAVAAPAALAGFSAQAVGRFSEVQRAMTRIGITADASAADVKNAGVQIRQLAMETAQPLDEVRKGLDALVASGKSMPEALGMLPAVARTAQASGAEVEDIAKTAQVLNDQFGIMGPRIQKAFDIMVTGGKQGSFELKDMARYMPSLAAQAAAFGMKGEEGLKSLVALMQTVRSGTGTSEEANSAISDLLGKIAAPEAMKKMAKVGIDVRKVMADARKEGKDLIVVMADLIRTATKGDMANLDLFYADKEIQKAIRAIVSMTDKYRKFRDELNSTDGSTVRDLNKVLGDSKTSIDRLGIAWDVFKTKLGEKIAPIVLPLVVDATKALDITAGNGPSVIDPNVNPANDPFGIPAWPQDVKAYEEAVAAGAAARADNLLPGQARERARVLRERAGRSKAQTGLLTPRSTARHYQPSADVKEAYELEEAARRFEELQAKAGLNNRVASAAINAPRVAGQVGSGVVSFGFGLNGTQNTRPATFPTAVPLPPERPSSLAPTSLHDALNGKIEAKLEGAATVKVDVSVQPHPDFLAEIRSAVSSATGHLDVSGPGSAGRSMPETEPPRSGALGRFGSN